VTSFQDRLQVELERAAAQPRTDRRRIGIAVAAAVLVLGALGGVLVSVSRPSPAAADVEIIRRDGVVTLRLVGQEYDADAIERSARDGGVELAVQDVATGPSLVGRFLNITFDGPNAVAVQRLSGAGIGYVGFAIPDDWPGRVLAAVGRPAKNGEAYGQTPDATSPGEPLACRPILGSPARAAVDVAQGLKTRWVLVQEGKTVAFDSASASGYLVAKAQMYDAKTVLLYLTPDGTLPGYTPPVVECDG
jgi:hypothetical protein